VTFSKEAQSLHVGDIFEHYRGNRYKIVAIARHTETLEEMVVYQAMQRDRECWVRPLGMFLETISIDDEQRPRFKKVWI
jgi:hypothetical protein